MVKASFVTKILFSVFLLSTLASCYHEVKEKVALPERLLSEDSLIDVLTEVQLADGAVTYKRISHKKTGNEKEKYYAYIYKKYHLTPELLKQNLDYYNSNPDKMIAIYDKVLARLSQLESKINLEVKAEEKAKQDSLQAIDTTILIRKTVPPYFPVLKPYQFTW